MIFDGEVMGFLQTTNAEQMRKFYQDVLGLKFVSDDPFALVLASDGTMIRIAKLTEFTPGSFTVLGWRVKDVDAEVKALHERGVTFNRYPGLEQSELGVWQAPGGTKIAWFVDPEGNVLSLSEHPLGQ